jgi:hypothetical protein
VAKKQKSAGQGQEVRSELTENMSGSGGGSKELLCSFGGKSC